jgi:hypothetical protein
MPALRRPSAGPALKWNRAGRRTLLLPCPRPAPCTAQAGLIALLDGVRFAMAFASRHAKLANVTSFYEPL